MKKLLLIINPKAGRAQTRRNVPEIIEKLSSEGILPSVYFTQSKKDATQIAEKLAPEFDTIVCYGGDGTLNEVICGVLASGMDRTIGYIPAGSTNDYAYSLHLPANVRDAAEVLAKGTEQASDIGLFHGRPFVYVAAFGAFTSTTYTTDQAAKNIFGHAAYFLEGARTIADIAPTHMTVTLDGEQIEDDFIFGMISNSESVGGVHDNLFPLDGVRLNDGYFEMLLIKNPTSLLDWNDIISCLTRKKGDDHFVYYRKVQSVSFHSPYEVSWTLDGESGGAYTDCDIAVRHQAVRILVPADNDEPASETADP